jgi:hypothetical protein
MKLKILLLLILPILLIAQYKKEYDIDHTALSKSNEADLINSAKTISNEYLEVTMIEGGYFTIGTTNGYSENVLDDNCQITFGHPYAKTSYPILFVDGQRYSFEDMFENSSIVKSDTSIAITGSNDELSSTFEIIFSSDGKSIHINFKTITSQESNQIVASGFVFDPALGKWGDGYVSINETYVDRESTIWTKDQSFFEIHERRTGANGLKVKFDLPASDDDQTSFFNWQFGEIYTPFTTASFVPEDIYDLLIVYVANTTDELEDPDTLIRSINMELLEPDFSSTLFARWDLPQFFTIDNGIVFPNEINSYLEVYNPTNSNVNVTSIYAEEPPNIIASPVTSGMNINGNSYNYAHVKVKSKIIYEDKIADVAMILQGSAGVLDVVSKRIFIPQTPVSEEGLSIVNDSINTSNFPNVDIVFSVDEDETGKRLRNLTEENIFLYENGSRIEDFEFSKYLGGGGGLVDIVFVLDISGSMGNEINAVRNNLNEFGQSLADNSYDYQIGVITFSTTVDHIWDFTHDLELIRQNLASINLWGGTEDSPSGLMAASNLSFRAGSKRTIIWVTDEPYPEDKYTKTQVVDRMHELGITVHGVGLNNLQTEWFDPIIIPTGGNFYDINGNFRDILMDVSNIDSEDRFHLSYESTSQQQENEIKLEIRYAGLGGNKTFLYNTPSLEKESTKLSFFPNPFNPSITFNVNMNNYKSGKVSIYNVLGQLVKQFDVLDNAGSSITWNAVNNYGQLVSTGFYLVQLTLQDHKNNKYTETAKILYLK